MFVVCNFVLQVSFLMENAQIQATSLPRCMGHQLSSIPFTHSPFLLAFHMLKVLYKIDDLPGKCSESRVQNVTRLNDLFLTTFVKI